MRIIVGGEKKKAYTPKRTKQSGSELKKKAYTPKRTKQSGSEIKKKAYTPKRSKQSGSELKKKASTPKRPQKSDGAQECTPGRKFEPNLDETENCKKFQKIVLTYWHLYVILQGASLWYGMFVYYAF